MTGQSEACPKCKNGISMVSMTGPSRVHIEPCGCQMHPQKLRKQPEAERSADTQLFWRGVIIALVGGVCLWAFVLLVLGAM